MVSRREFLTIGTSGLAAASLTARAGAQAPAPPPKRGGTLSLRMWDPPHFDHILAHAYKTHVVISFTHSRLLKHKAGPSVRPGALQIEGDLAESWQQTSDTTYVFKLKKGVRFHAKAPVNGRELTAEDVRYTFERILTDKGSVNVSMYRSIAKVEAVDKYTVRFTLKEPFAWFLDMMANPMAGAIIAKECVEKFGDLKKPEAVIGTGPWMLDGYKPNVSITLVRNPTYFVPGLPHIERVEMFVDEDNASRMAAFLGGKYDLGWDNPGTIPRTDWVQISEALKKRRPNLKTAGIPLQRDEHHRHADGQAALQRRPRAAGHLARHGPQGHDRRRARGAGRDQRPDAGRALGVGAAHRAARRRRKYYRHDPAEAKRLLAAAGHPNGFSASVCFSTYGSTSLVDTMQLLLKDLKAVGIDAKLDQKEYGAYQATCRVGKFDSMVYGPLTPFVEPDSFLFGQYYTGEPRNRSHVNDPVLDDLLVRQRRASDPKARREVINQIERHLAKQQYYVQSPSGTYIAVWDPALKNYAPSIGFDYGGRLMAAWLDR